MRRTPECLFGKSRRERSGLYAARAPGTSRALEEFGAFECDGGVTDGGVTTERAAARRSDLDQTLADRVADDAGGVRRVELLHDVRAMGLRGLHADPEQLGDFLRGLPGRDQLQDLALTRRERIGGQLGLREVRLDHRPRDARAQ